MRYRSQVIIPSDFPRSQGGLESKVIRSCLVAVLMMPLASSVQAQSACAPATIVGIVERLPQRAPVRGAEVAVGERRTTTSADGRFVLADVGPEQTQLRVSASGLAERVLPIRPCGPDSLRLFLRLAARAPQLEQVVVTASEVARTAEGSSVSRIGRDAIEHVQASSLADVLQLVPGQAAVNPSLAGARQALLRQAPTGNARDPGPGTEAERANALGTSVVLDGVPVSNNANLQTTLTILNSGPNALPPFSSTAGRGLDLRQVPADQIESVEVVRGVPSARHGDLTAGAILVTSRAGALAPELRVRVNPQTLEASTVAGWGRATRDGLAFDANVVSSQDDPRSTLDRFTRVTTQLAFTHERPRLGTSVRLRQFGVLDESRQDPDDRRYQRRVTSRDQGARLDLRLRLGARTGWFTELTASGQLATQRSTYQELVTRDIFPLSAARVDTLAPGVYGRSEYLAQLMVDGRPRNGYARLETRRSRSWRGLRHDPVFGAELRFDENAGAGRIFNPIEPPRQNYGVGDRPQSFQAVPSQTQLAAYAEHRVRAIVRGRAVDAVAGVRLDAIDPSFRGRTSGAYVVPRLALSTVLSPQLTWRVSHGVTTKAPTLSQRYPLPRYFDLTSFNYYPANPAERLVLFTTKAVQVPTSALRSAQATKSETGFDWQLGRQRGTMTVFREQTRGAFGTSRVPIGIAVPQFAASSFPVGRPPVLHPVPVRVDSFVGLYDVPRNTRAIATTGAEVTVDTPEWSRLRTQLSISGGWFRTVARDADVEIPVEQFISGSVQPARVGVYAGGRGSESVRALTSVRLVHRAPPLGLLISLLWQTTWQDDDRPVGRTDGVPLGYVDRSGRITTLTASEATAPPFSALVRAVTPLEGRWERRPPLHLFNLRLTKTLPGRTQVALFANNALADRPLYQRQRQIGFERRNQPAFFGLELLAALPTLL